MKTQHYSTHKTQVSFRLSDEMYEALDEIKVRVGIPLSEQLRRGLDLWLAQQKASSNGASEKKAGRK
jgi:predicted DNA-binding protein